MNRTTLLAIAGLLFIASVVISRFTTKTGDGGTRGPDNPDGVARLAERSGTTPRPANRGKQERTKAVLPPGIPLSGNADGPNEASLPENPEDYWTWTDPHTRAAYLIKKEHHPEQYVVSNPGAPDSVETFWNVPDNQHIEFDGRGNPQVVEDGLALGPDDHLYPKPPIGILLELGADGVVYELEEGLGIGPDNEIYERPEGTHLEFAPDGETVITVEND